MVFNDNACSWIKLPLNVNPSAPAALPCVIKNNTLKGYDTNFRKNYLGGGSTGLSNKAIELIMIGTSFTEAAIIDGNWIDLAAYATVSPPVSFFAYDTGISTMHDANICNNFISNLSKVLSGSNPIGIELITGSNNNSSNVHHNKIYRLSNVWQAYVHVGTNSLLKHI